jgi:hypothetical protein
MNQKFTSTDPFDTEEARAMMQRVLKRCGQLCEGCLDQPAKHVIRDRDYGVDSTPPLYEMRGVCDACYEFWRASVFSDAYAPIDDC